MPNGDPGNPEELPDLEEPPKFIEGAAGGPAFPVDGLSEQDKQTNEDAANLMFGVGYRTRYRWGGGYVCGRGIRRRRSCIRGYVLVAERRYPHNLR